ncbi:MFS transporter [Arthrobacter sp. SDTb3-6]|uniref:MFS transporter n=1 Tax=Arthrobacter sp. SDTb3-6 TaxID=2713571 RepID=UPI00352449F6
MGLAVAGAVGGFLFGFDSSVVNGAVDAIHGQFHLGGGLTGFTIAVALLGCAAGAYVAGRIADAKGRIPAMKLGALLFFASAIGTGLAFNVVDLIFWRLIGGLGIGLASVIAPAYISEISPRRHRGRLASLQQLAITVGIFAHLLSDALFATRAGGAVNVLWLGLPAWRWMFLAGIVPAVAYGWIAFVLPESPRFLVLQGKEDAARKVFLDIAPDEDAGRNIRDIEDAVKEDSLTARKGSLRGGRFGLLPVGLDRHHPLGPAAVCRHQRHLLLVFVISFGASWGPLVWVLLGEIFPSRIRVRALGLAAAAQWIANFLITLSFPVMASASLPLTYGLYALFAAASFFFVMVKVPETNGMSLEQADTLFVTKAGRGSVNWQDDPAHRAEHRTVPGLPRSGGRGPGRLPATP